MTGQGTSSEPYIVMTADDLYSIGGNESKGKYFRLGADIDFNGTDYAENFKPITLKCATLDGAGHVIRNIYYNNSGTASIFIDGLSATSGTCITIENMNFENIELVGTKCHFIDYDIGSYAYTIALKNCIIPLKFTFTSEITNTSSNLGCLFSGNRGMARIEKCSVIAELNAVKSYPITANGTIIRSQFRINYRLKKTTTQSEASSALFYNTNMTDSYVFGTVSIESPNSGNLLFYATNGNHNNSYQVIDYRNIHTMNWNACLITPCFYDKDVASEITSVTNSPTASGNISGNLYGLTTEQCKDAEYLRSIGFICEGAD